VDAEGADAGRDADADADTDGTDDDGGCGPGYVGIDLDYRAEGGFVGGLFYECTLAGGAMTVFDPLYTLDICTGTLTADQLRTLLDAADGVAWASFEATYVNPENPGCCCDQGVYHFTTTLTRCELADQTVTTEWCDESIPDRLPADLSAFVGTLRTICQAVLDGC
jgi:hypothetical protein